MVIRLTVFFFALSLFSFSYSQKGRTVAQPKTETKQKELSKLREEISTIEGQLNKIGTKEKKTFSTIEKFNKQIFLINKLVSNLKEEEEEKQMQIEEIQGQSENLQKELDNLKKNYSSYVNATYKKLYQNKLLYLLSAKSISQGILRQYYLKTFSERGKGDAERIARTQFDLRKLEEEISRELIQVKGVGVWSIHMFLMFTLCRLDVLPVGDLGIRKAVQNIYKLKSLPDEQTIAKIAKKNRWSPYSSIASWYLWRSLDNK